MVELSQSATLAALAALIEERVTVTGVAALAKGAVAVAARQRVMIRARSAGGVALQLVSGSVVVPVQPGTTELDLAATRYLAAGSDADADVFTLTTSGAPFVTATALIRGAAAIAPGTHVLINCTVGGDAAFALSGGGTIMREVQPGLSLLPLSANQLVSAGTTAELQAWSLAR